MKRADFHPNLPKQSLSFPGNFINNGDRREAISPIPADRRSRSSPKPAHLKTTPEEKKS
ncbi:MAG: hypothetical protein ACP5D7_02375 [Limnospira sp.]